MSKRTRIEFSCPGDLLSIVEPWASENGYIAKQSTASGRLYQKGRGFLVLPMMFSIEQVGERTVIEIWLRANLFMRAMALFIFPAEMGIESGGFKGLIPRKIARAAVNKLLAKLRQPLIP